MKENSPRRRQGRARRAALLPAALALALAATTTIGVTPAAAHDQLLSSTPAEGAVLNTAPLEAILRFSDAVLPIGAIVIVVDETDKDWAAGEPILDGSTVTVQLPETMPDGSYEIRWRVVSRDGHPISGLITFAVGVGTPKSTNPETPGAPSTAAPSSEKPSASAPPPSSESQPEVAGVLRPVLLGLGGAGAALLLLWLISAAKQRRKHRSTDNPRDRQTDDSHSTSGKAPR